MTDDTGPAAVVVLSPTEAATEATACDATGEVRTGAGLVASGVWLVASGVCDIADDARAGDEVVPVAELRVAVDTGDCPVVAATSWREVHPVEATTQAANNTVTIERR